MLLARGQPCRCIFTSSRRLLSSSSSSTHSKIRSNLFEGLESNRTPDHNKTSVYTVESHAPSKNPLRVYVTRCNHFIEKWVKENFREEVLVNATATEREKQPLSRSNTYNPELDVAVGFDIEWKPSFTAGVENKVALMQLSVQDSCLLIQLKHMDIRHLPLVLLDLLKSDRILKVGIGVYSDLMKLKKDYGIRSLGFCDVGVVVKRVIPPVPETTNLGQNLSLSETAKICLDARLSKSKSVRMSNWEADVLSLPQITYAANDASIAFQIYEFLVQKGAFNESSLDKHKEQALGLLKLGTREEIRRGFSHCSESGALQQWYAQAIEMKERDVKEWGSTLQPGSLGLISRLGLQFEFRGSQTLSKEGTFISQRLICNGRVLQVSKKAAKAVCRAEAIENCILELRAVLSEMTPTQRLECYLDSKSEAYELIHQYISSKPVYDIEINPALESDHYHTNDRNHKPLTGKNGTLN